MRSVALAGKPNAGKSTFYKAATLADVAVGNYPFTTIDPNRGVSHVRTECPCLDMEERCGNEHCHDGKRYVPIELVDVAGLVPGAHEGRGLGNQFLDALTNADVILNVVDASGGTNAEGEPVEAGSYDPVRDVEFVAEEMDLWLAGIVERNWESVERQSRSPEFDMDEALTDLLTGVGATVADVAAVQLLPPGTVAERLEQAAAVQTVLLWMMHLPQKTAAVCRKANRCRRNRIASRYSHYVPAKSTITRSGKTT